MTQPARHIEGVHEETAITDINVTPLTDVFMVLLVIFMVTAPMMIQSAIRVDLPRVAETGPASDVGILPSHEEGFSNAILEGMAAGLPMVVTRVGGNPEAVVHGVTGLVVPPRDPSAMAAAVLDLVRDPARRQRMGEAGRHRVEEAFSLDACVDRYARLYRMLSGATGEPVSEVLAAKASS